MTTRTYYLPKGRIATHLINYMYERVGCSIGDIKINKVTDTIRVPITCNDSDVQKIEQILSRYGMIDKKGSNENA